MSPREQVLDVDPNETALRLARLAGFDPAKVLAGSLTAAVGPEGARIEATVVAWVDTEAVVAILEGRSE